MNSCSAGRRTRLYEQRTRTAQSQPRRGTKSGGSGCAGARIWPSDRLSLGWASLQCWHSLCVLVPLAVLLPLVGAVGKLALAAHSQARVGAAAPVQVGCLVACCLVLAGDLVLTLVEGRSRVLGRGAVVDLSAVHSEANFCVLVGAPLPPGTAGARALAPSAPPQGCCRRLTPGLASPLAQEFESGEAERESCAHSWLFWFATAEEKEQFLAVVSACWQEIFQVCGLASPQWPSSFITGGNRPTLGV